MSSESESDNETVVISGVTADEIATRRPWAETHSMTARNVELQMTFDTDSDASVEVVFPGPGDRVLRPVVSSRAPVDVLGIYIFTCIYCPFFK
jgi:hypothetical protein